MAPLPLSLEKVGWKSHQGGDKQERPPGPEPQGEKYNSDITRWVQSWSPTPHLLGSQGQAPNSSHGSLKEEVIFLQGFLCAEPGLQLTSTGSQLTGPNHCSILPSTTLLLPRGQHLSQRPSI